MLLLCELSKSIQPKITLRQTSYIKHKLLCCKYTKIHRLQSKQILLCLFSCVEKKLFIWSTCSKQSRCCWTWSLCCNWMSMDIWPCWQTDVHLLLQFWLLQWQYVKEKQFTKTNKSRTWDHKSWWKHVYFLFFVEFIFGDGEKNSPRYFE